MEQGSMRPKDRESAKGLLPRMEARPRKDGKVTYRYHIAGGRPVNLGTDRLEACRRVLDLLGIADDRGTIGKLWELYRESLAWQGLRERTRADYEAYSVELLRVFGTTPADTITAPDVARYLRVERKAAPVRANREVALLGNLIGLAIERGEATTNPCRGGLVRRNTERASDTLPERSDIEALIALAAQKGGTWVVVTCAAEFAALTGARQAEFLPLCWPAWDDEAVRLPRAKQRKGVQKVDRIEASPALTTLRGRLLAYQRSPLGAVFPNRKGNAYTASGFASMWQKLMVEAVKAGKVGERFNFHALRAYYATQHKAGTGALPDMHASPTTTARVYERSKMGRRKAL